MQEMVVEQNNAEKKRTESIETKNQMEVKSQEIAERTEVVNNDLSKAEPALIAAQNSVDSIEKTHLD